MFLLACGYNELPAIFQEAVIVPSNRASALDADADADSYIEKVGRWGKDAIHGIKDIDFWRLMVCKHVTRAPMQKIQMWCQQIAKSQKDSEVLPPMLQLCIAKADEIYCMWEELLSDDMSCWSSLLDLLPEDQAEYERWLAVAVSSPEQSQKGCESYFRNFFPF